MTAPLPGAVVVVIDDDRSILDALEILLESADYTVHLFSSAEALLDSGCVAKADCLISDIGLPIMNGYELSQAIHALRPELPIILITGQSDAPPPRRPGDLPAYPQFKKPFDGEALLQAVENALRNPPSHRRNT